MNCTESDVSNGNPVPTEAMDNVEHSSITKEGEGLAMQSEYGAESMELEVPIVTLQTPTSQDDTEQSEHSEQLRATVSESETQTIQEDDPPTTIEPNGDVPNDKGSVEEELNSIQESPLEEEVERKGEGEETEGEEEKREEQEEETEGEMEQHTFSVAQVVQELERPVSLLVADVQDVERPLSALLLSNQEGEIPEQHSHAEPKAVVSTHHASTQTTDDTIPQILRNSKDYDMDSLSNAELIDSQDALYALLSCVQRKLSERLSLDI